MTDAITVPGAPEAGPPPTAAAPVSAPAAAPAPAPAPATKGPPVRFGAGVLRTTLVCFVFLILLPFWASLPMMLYQRLSKGIILDTAGLGILAFFFTLLMLLVIFEMVLSIRAKVHLGETGVRIVLPSRGGLMPMLGYRRSEIPYADIDKVEIRREVYGGTFAPVLLRGARIVLKDGKTVPLGYVSEADMDPTFPVPEIAAEIARRAGVPLVDMGSVQRNMRKKFMGLKASDAENTLISEEQIAVLNKSHSRFMLMLVAAMVVLLVLGIGSDIMTGTIDRGELARDAIQKK